MPFYKTQDLSLWTTGTWYNLDKKNIEIKGFSIDSRKIEKNTVFVALVDKRDGHDFAKDAIEKGASAVIASKQIEGLNAPLLLVKDTLVALQTIAKMHRLRLDYPVIGITGSCGKTSTKELLAKLLSFRNPSYSQENFNNEIGVALSLTNADVRTNKAAIIEAGVAGPNQMEVLAKIIEPDISIITNVSSAHIEKFGDVSAVAREKAILPEHAYEDGYCIMHGNLLSWKSFDELPCKKAVAIPMNALEMRADLLFKYDLKFEEETCKIELCLEGGREYYFECKILSQGMAENAILAIICALMLGASEEQISKNLESYELPQMRGTSLVGLKSTFHVDCYNANPSSMKDSLSFFLRKSNDEKPRLFVLGSMAELGIASLRYHKDIGSSLPYRVGDKAILVGDNASIYKEAMLESGWSEDAIKTYEKSSLAKGDLSEFEGHVFVKGSRVFELEKSLPDDIQEKLMMEPEKEIVEEEVFEEVEEPKQESEEADDDDEGDEFSDEEFDDENAPDNDENFRNYRSEIEEDDERF